MDEVASDTLSVICEVLVGKSSIEEPELPLLNPLSPLTSWTLLDQTLTCKSGMILPCHLALRKAQSQTSNKKVSTHKSI